MKPVLVTPKNEAERKFLSDLLKKLGISSRIMTEEEAEDIGLSLLLKKVDRTKKVNRSVILKKLSS